MKPTVAYSSFCCQKDMERIVVLAEKHLISHQFQFDEKFFVLQRCPPSAPVPDGFTPIRIYDRHYPDIFSAFGIQWPDPVLDELTHGWDASHFHGHHTVNHLETLLYAKSDYVVFADGDCYMKEQPEGTSWINRGIEILETNPDIFVVCPNEGGPERRESIMSQQMFIINRKRFIEMEFIPWDGTFIDGGPMQEWYGMLEGKISRFMTKNKLWRYVLGPEFRYWHLEFH